MRPVVFAILGNVTEKKKRFALSLKLQNPTVRERKFPLCFQRLAFVQYAYMQARIPQQVYSAELVNSPKMLLPVSMLPFPYRSSTC